MSEYTEHRKFVHDISNQIAINEGAVKRLIKLLPEEIKVGEVLESLEIAEKYAKSSINKLKEYRTFIHEMEKKSN